MVRIADPDETFGPVTMNASPRRAWWGRDPKKLRDDPLWESYIADLLSTAELKQLMSLFTTSDRAFGLADADEREWTSATRDWILDVLAIDVDIKRSGRAVLRQPPPPAGWTSYRPFRVEFHFAYNRTTKAPRLTSVHAIADDYMDSFYEALTIGERYFAAFALAYQRSRGAMTRAPRKRPKSGAALDLDFYRRVLATYDALKTEGHADPAAELARRMDENHSTVKSWLRRGRLYLKEER